MIGNALSLLLVKFYCVLYFPCLVIIQSENKKFKIASDNLTGPLLLVNHIVKQDYFPQHTAKTLHFYLTQ